MRVRALTMWSSILIEDSATVSLWYLLLFGVDLDVPLYCNRFLISKKKRGSEFRKWIKCLE